MISTFKVDNKANYQSSKRAKVNFASLAAISKVDEIRKDDNKADSKLSKIDWAIDPVSECVCPSAPGTAGQVAPRSHTCLYRLCHMYWKMTSPSFSLSKFFNECCRMALKRSPRADLPAVSKWVCGKRLMHVASHVTMVVKHDFGAFWITIKVAFAHQMRIANAVHVVNDFHRRQIGRLTVFNLLL